MKQEKIVEEEFEEPVSEENPKEEEEPQPNIQAKISIEVKLSKNYNTVTFGIQDEPIPSRTDEEFKTALKKKAELLRNVAEEELKLINSLPK